MYEEFYGLRAKPFSLSPDPDYLFLSPKHKTALVYLEYGITEQAGFIVITGEIGTGKTTLVKYLLNKLSRQDPAIKIAYLFNTTLTPLEFLKALLQELEVPFSASSKTALLESLHQFLIQQYAGGHRVVVIIDEAQNLSLATLEEIRMLSNLQTEKEHLVQIVLIGQPNLRDNLRHPQLRQFSQRILVNYHLLPLDLSETEAYIHHRLRLSQLDPADDRYNRLFTRGAIESIYQYSKGIPRLINILCDTALVYGFAEEKEQIEADLVEQVVEDKRQGGILIQEERASSPVESELTGLPSNGQNEVLGHRVLLLEQRVNELQQKVLSTLHSFSQLLEERRQPAGNLYDSVLERLEQLLAKERERCEQLEGQLKKYKAQLQELLSQKMALEDQLARKGHRGRGKASGLFKRKVFWLLL